MSLVQGSYTEWYPAGGQQPFVAFGRSGKHLNWNGPNTSDGSDIEDWIVDAARVEVEKSYQEHNLFSDSSDDSESDIVKTTSDTECGHSAAKSPFELD